MSSKLTEKDLKREIFDFKERFPVLGDDEVFVLWFLRAFIAEDEQDAAKALCGGSHDKGIDAVFIDHDTKIVFIVQGKYRQGIGLKNEHRPDIVSFAQIAIELTDGKDAFNRFSENLSPEVFKKLQDARQNILKHHYSLHLFYVTTGKCSKTLADEASRITRSASVSTVFQIIENRQIILLLSDYLDGVAPPVPSLDLEVEHGQGVSSTGILNRYDKKTDIESWVFSMSNECLAGLYKIAGVRLFARNIRGFLGNTEINRGMTSTLMEEPEYFWYYNNGITVICDDAKEERARGREILRVTNPQIINGQQTTRTVANSVDKTQRASVLVRVIRIPRKENKYEEPHQFDTLVSEIVSATNWQNAIRPSDLMSNDRRQIEIERQFRKLGYFYLRKRETKKEARRRCNTRQFFLIRKEEIAQAVAGCDFDPSILREGKERLFEEKWYATIFPTADPYYYLSRYWVLRQVSYAARGYPERAYAKWLTLNFIWIYMEKLLRARNMSVAFKKISEGNDYSLNHFISAIGKVFVASLKFYRMKRGKGATATDVSTFFQRRNLHKGFVNYWKGSGNKSRKVFHKLMKRFENSLRN